MIQQQLRTHKNIYEPPQTIIRFNPRNTDFQNVSPFCLEVQLADPQFFFVQQSILSISLSNHPLSHRIDSEFPPDRTTNQSQTQLTTNITITRDRVHPHILLLLGLMNHTQSQQLYYRLTKHRKSHILEQFQRI